MQKFHDLISRLWGGLPAAVTAVIIGYTGGVGLSLALHFFFG